MNIITVPILAVRNTVLFPHAIVPLSAGRERSLAAVEAALQGDHTLAIFTQRDPAVINPGPPDLFEIGTLANVRRAGRQEGGYQLGHPKPGLGCRDYRSRA